MSADRRDSRDPIEWCQNGRTVVSAVSAPHTIFLSRPTNSGKQKSTTTKRPKISTTNLLAGEMLGQGHTYMCHPEFYDRMGGNESRGHSPSHKHLFTSIDNRLCAPPDLYRFGCNADIVAVSLFHADTGRLWLRYSQNVTRGKNLVWHQSSQARSSFPEPRYPSPRG